MHVLVVGCGSIGKRHIQNLKSLNIEKISICDSNPQRVDELGENFNIPLRFTKLSDALKQDDLTAGVVCVPTSYHIQVALELASRGCHIFMEKPLARDLTDIDKLISLCEKKKLVFMVAYMFRFHPGLRLVSDIINSEKIGQIYGARVECGQYLPDWHPWEDYRTFYMSKKERGGGALLDISHEFDYLCHFIKSPVKSIACFYDTLGKLEMDSDNISSTILKFKNGAIASVHLDLLQRAARRNCQLIGEFGTVVWDIANKLVKLYTVESKRWEEIPYVFDGNQAYIDEMKHFFECIKENKKPVVDINDAKKTLEIVLSAKKSSEAKQIIELKNAG